MIRTVQEIQEDIRTLTRISSFAINEKLNELADEIEQLSDNSYKQGILDERADWERAAAELLIKYAGNINEALPDMVKDIQNKARLELINILIEEFNKPCSFDVNVYRTETIKDILNRSITEYGVLNYE